MDEVLNGWRDRTCFPRSFILYLESIDKEKTNSAKRTCTPRGKICPLFIALAERCGKSLDSSFGIVHIPLNVKKELIDTSKSNRI